MNETISALKEYFIDLKQVNTLNNDELNDLGELDVVNCRVCFNELPSVLIKEFIRCVVGIFQVMFHNAALYCGFSIQKTCGTTQIEEIIAKCMTSVDYADAADSSDINAKTKTCTTVTLAALKTGDSLYLKGIHPEGGILTQREAMFWGAVKLDQPNSGRRSRRRAKKSTGKH